MLYFTQLILSNMFRLLLLPSSGWCNYYRNTGTDVVSCVLHQLGLVVGDVWTVWYTVWNCPYQYTTTSTHHLQPVPNDIPQHPHITYNQFQTIYHNIHTSPTNSSNRYTTTSTHHLQPVPTDIPQHPHITYNQFQPIYHTANYILLLYCYNNYITTKMAAIAVETCCWEYCE
jgi:hypothetical protein